jgi:ABC-type multidrug transport system fused ATPase/permease subunit
MFLRNFLLISNASKLSGRWSQALADSIKRYRHRYFNRSYNINKSHSKCEDVERGLKQQYIDSKTQYNNNENEVKTCSRNELLSLGNSEQTSGKSVNFRLGLKIVGSLIVIALASFIAFYMDNLTYALLSFFIALLTILLISGYWRWFYIAGVTANRDIV